MAITFDGVAKLITLESGVTEVDVADIYSEWKQWVNESYTNSKYLPAFRTIGGDPLSSIINAGAYYFLRNDFGWRIKPPEEDITIYTVGNLAVEDTALPAFIPTVGAFTAAILGLQPVTQGVTPSMQTQLEANVFQNAVTIDVVNGYPGVGYEGENPIGTRQAPSNNTGDTNAIAQQRGLRQINVAKSLTIASTDFSVGRNFVGDSPFLVVTVDPSANVSSCDFDNVTVVGQLDGVNVVRDCSVGVVTDVNGIFEKCAFQSNVTLNGDTFVFECYSQVAGSGYPIFDCGDNDLTLRNYNGSVGVMNTGVNHISSLAVYGGRVVIDATCAGGEIHVRGDPFEIVDNSSPGCTVFDETESQKLREIHQANFNRRNHNKVANTITIYDEDKVTPIFVFDADDDLTDISPQ